MGYSEELGKLEKYLEIYFYVLRIVVPLKLIKRKKIYDINLPQIVRLSLFHSFLELGYIYSNLYFFLHFGGFLPCYMAHGILVP